MGGLRNGLDAYKAMAMGADGVGFGAAAEIAMGCRACMACSSGKCPYGITSQDPRLRARLIPEEAGNRLANFIHATAEELKILTMLSGHDDIKDLSDEDLRAMDYETAAITGLKLIGYERRLPWWEMDAQASQPRAERIIWSRSIGDPAAARSAQQVALAESAKHN
jgi:hypothetical protein